MVPAPGPLLDRHLRDPPGGIDGAVRQEPPPGGCRWPGATPHRRLSGTRRGSPHQYANAVPLPQTPRAVSLSSSPSYRKTVSDPVRVVVVTPVRNEAWILERFLSVTSRFADHIIVADQRSSDGSRAICSRYPNVTVIDNPTDEFNERDRQLLLLRQARALVPPPRVILALDADEILAANRSEEHTSELQSHSDLVCRLLLEKKKKTQIKSQTKTKKKKTNSKNAKYK